MVSIKEDGSYRVVEPSISADRFSALESNTVSLVYESIAGGVMGGYVEEGFPLYYINSRLLHYLGYEDRAQFEEAIGGMVINCMYPDDRERVDAQVAANLKGQDEYEVKYRMLRRDGSAFWVLDRGKRFYNEEGREVITSVIIDIDDSVRLQEDMARQSEMLRAKNEELTQFYDAFVSGVIKLEGRAPFTVLYNNDHFQALMGYGKGEDGLVGSPVAGLLWPADLNRFQAFLEEAVRGERPAPCTVRLQKAGGKPYWVQVNVRCAKGQNGSAPLLYCLFIDVDAQQEKEKAYRKQEHFMSLILSDIVGGVFITYLEPPYPLAYVSESLLTFLGYSRKAFEQASGGVFMPLVCEEDWGRMALSVSEQVARCGHYEVEYRIIKSDGALVWVLEKGNSALDEEGQPILVCLLMDISQRRKQQEKLVRRSRLDSLTDVYNRATAQREIDRHLAMRPPEELSAFFMLDLDDFKVVNDKLGHIAGDGLLVELAKLLRENFREGDVVGRLGGDEFIVFLKGVKERAFVEQKAAYLCKRVKEAFQSGFGELAPSVSIGVAVAGPGRQADFGSLYRVADEALYMAKSQGKNTYQVLEG